MLRKLMMMFAVGALCAFTAVPGQAQTPGKRLILAVPGIPPIFAAVIAYVAEQEGFFKRYGAEVEIRPFDTGTAAARAVLAGDIDIAISPTPLIINQISNSNANVVSIYGFPNPDWILASTDPAKTSCKDISGQPVGVDAVGGARSIALRTMLVGCPGVKIEDVQQVALSSNTAPAMVAGRLAFGVLHLDDVAILEMQGKSVKTLLAMKETNPDSHYLVAVARVDRLKENRDAFVQAVAGLVAAARYMREQNNADRVAEIASPTGHSKEIAKLALRQFNDMGFWAVDDAGMDRKKLDALIATQTKVGGILAGKEPVKFDRLVDDSVWKDARALVDKR
jgi:ABC-type nitrate/sulfonate/bicarbonate transport system substrate-binding protein